MATATLTMEQPQDISSKVLRRAQVSQMTRALQDRLALANLKFKHGWQHRSMDSLEPEIEQELKRKRSDSQGDPFSDTSSLASIRCFSSADALTSSPLTQPFFSDEVPRSGSSQSNKKLKMGPPPPRSTLHTLRKKQRPARIRTASWKRAHQLPESSPIAFKRSYSIAAAQNDPRSFVSETSTVMDSPSSSEDDDQDIPIHSFQLQEINISSSPPRTPPPHFSRPVMMASSPFSSPTISRKDQVKEGADLLLYMASSPSPGMRASRTDSFVPPTTPPSKNTQLPSSMLGTPGNLFGFAPVTPGTGFNFADFVNVTPSPAQAAFPKTPGTIRTPTATRDSRRRLQMTPLMGVSPNADSGDWSVARKSRSSKIELGGELGA